MKQKLQIDPYFKRLSVPATEEEQKQLEASLLREGCKEPVITWNGVILDGHKRYEICSYEEIGFEVVNKRFHSREEAAAWLCGYRIPKIKLYQTMFKYLVGEKYLLEKQLYIKLQEAAAENGKKIDQWRGSFAIANEFGINRSSVQRFGKLAVSLDLIAEKDLPMFYVIVEERIHTTYAQIDTYAQMDSAKLANTRRRLLREEEVKMRRRYPELEKAARDRKKENDMKQTEKPLDVKIKDMPAYDPDMEVRGLTLTIPAWMNAIARARDRSKMEEVSDAARAQLVGSLHRLEEQIDEMLEVVER